MNPVDEIKNTISGAAALADWLGAGGSPVDPMVANFRAQRCLTGNNGAPCDLNVQPNWWDRVKSEIARWIRAELELKNRMALKVDGEDKLHMCKNCGCALPLKVWVPTRHIRDHTDAEKLKTYPEWCWIKRELSDKI